MDSYQKKTYGERIAGIYDELYAGYDPVSQLITSQHVALTEAGIRLYPVKIRYAWPSELDLMARVARLRLRSRWSDWRGGEFTSASGKHISIYEQGSNA